MIFLPSAFYQHIVNVELHISFNLMYEHFVHEPLICCAHVLKAERHHFVAKKALAGNE